MGMVPCVSVANPGSCSDGLLSSRSGEIVVKPCKQSEIDFYESTRSHPEFSLYIPAYLGTLSLGEGHSVQPAGAIVLPAQTSPELQSTTTFGGELVIENHWTPSNGGKIQTDLAIVLENVAVDFKKPNILDVKLGARLWADDAPPDKRARLDKAAGETTSGPLAFRIAGMKTYHGQDSDKPSGVNGDGYKLFDKAYGRAFGVDTVRRGFEDYFLLPHQKTASGGLRKLIRRFVEDLQGMADTIAHEESRMYSASLLFVYEGDRDALAEAFAREKDVLATIKDKQGIQGDEGLDAPEGNAGVEGEGEESEEEEGVKFPAIQSLKLIDFAHAQWTPGQGPDENLLRGIRNVAKILVDLAG